MNVFVTAQHIRAVALKPVNEANMNSVLVSLDRYRDDFGMDRVHRVVQYLAQLMHESGDFRFDREIWGPTPAQARYDTRGSRQHASARWRRQEVHGPHRHAAHRQGELPGVL